MKIRLFFSSVAVQAPPPLRASPERDGEIDFVAVDAKPMVIDADTVSGPPLPSPLHLLKSYGPLRT